MNGKRKRRARRSNALLIGVAAVAAVYFLTRNDTPTVQPPTLPGNTANPYNPAPPALVAAVPRNAFRPRTKLYV